MLESVVKQTRARNGAVFESGKLNRGISSSDVWKLLMKKEGLDEWYHKQVEGGLAAKDRIAD